MLCYSLYTLGCTMPGGGLLRLHSTYRHDLKIYSSDEGRVEMTAAAFAKVIMIIREVILTHYMQEIGFTVFIVPFKVFIVL